MTKTNPTVISTNLTTTTTSTITTIAVTTTTDYKYHRVYKLSKSL